MKAGIGKPAERAYYYRTSENPLSSLNITIDTGLTRGRIDHGVILGEGDGTVNLLSLGYMCNKGWNMHRYNPAGVQVKVYEMPHEPDRFSPRGGPNTGDHVDILGRQSLNDMILRVAAGHGDELGENVVSDIDLYADRVKIFEEEGFVERTKLRAKKAENKLQEKFVELEEKLEEGYERFHDKLREL